jgi:H+/gluconate symporter-like permease
MIGFLGILAGLCLLIWLAYRSWSVLLLAPATALLAALLAGEPLLAHWTQTFMGSAARFIAQFFPLFLLGAVFAKLMEDSGSVSAIANFMTKWLGERRAILAVVLAGAVVTYGGVSLFVAMFVLASMAQELFRSARVPRRLIPAAIILGTSTFTMSALPGSPSIQNAIPMPYFGTTLFAAPGLGVIAAIIMFAFGMWWLSREEARARAIGEDFGEGAPALSADQLASDEKLRERATMAREFDPAELMHGRPATSPPTMTVATFPLVMVVSINLAMSLIVLPRLDAGFLAEQRWGGTSLSSVAGVWAIVTALACSIAVVIAINYRRLPTLRETMDAGANAAVLPCVTVASMVGFGAVIAALPAFGAVREGVLAIGGGPLVSLAVATNLLAALTGSASGGLTIALDALAETYLSRASEAGLDPGLLHRVAVIGAGTLDILPHSGAVVTLLGICGSTHSEGYRDLAVAGIVSAALALVAVIVLGSMLGSF